MSILVGGWTSETEKDIINRWSDLCFLFVFHGHLSSTSSTVSTLSTFFILPIMTECRFRLTIGALDRKWRHNLISWPRFLFRRFVENFRLSLTVRNACWDKWLGRKRGIWGKKWNFWEFRIHKESLAETQPPNAFRRAKPHCYLSHCACKFGTEVLSFL